jgi:hypothetical protein
VGQRARRRATAREEKRSAWLLDQPVGGNGGAAMSESKFATEVRKAIKIAIRGAGARQG